MSLTLSAGKGLARFLVGPFGVALAAAATAAAFVANAVDESADSVATFTEQLKNNELSLRVTSLQAYTQAQIDLRSAVAEAELALYQETGVLDSLDIAQMRSVQTTRESARAVLLEAAAIGARLEVQRQSLQARVDANDFTVIEKAQGVDDAARERLKVLSREIPLANQRLDALKEEVDQKVINVNETYNEIRAAKEKAEADREAEKAARSSGRASVSASKASADAAREAARATEEWLSTLDLVVEASARLDAEREILAQAAEGPTASQIDSWRELGSAVEELVPQAAIDRTTQLLLLLDQLELAATADGRAAAALADDISRVRSALAVEEADRWIAEMDSAAAATEDASGRITGSVRSMVSSVGELLGGAGPLGGLVSGLADAERISARMTERAMQRGASAEDIAGIADAAEGRSDAISAAAGIAGPFLDEIANGAAGGRAVAKMAAGFITGLAKGIGPFIQAFVLNADKIVIALVKAGPQIVAGIIKAVVRIGKGIARSFVDGIGEGLRRVARQIARVVVDAVTPGNRRRRRIRVGDTPGPVRVPRGGTIEAAPGDMVVAARNTQGLRNQLGPAASGSGGETTVTTILDVRDGPIRLGISRSTTRELDRRGVGRDMTGRRRAY